MEPKIATVSQINGYIKKILDTNIILNDIWIKGEISNFKLHYSGHMYITLKDSGGVLKAVMFKSAASGLSFRPEDGMKVLARGRISVYEAGGAYQLYINEMLPDGVGELYIAYEQLKKRLEAEGLFSAEHKKPLPPYPERVGVITASTGAAVRDIINVITRRYPYAEIILYPSLVQGAGAAENICRGLEYFNSTHMADVIIAGRGGGSIEDLWAFNEEIVAQAVFDCSVPVISAVGHETDTTIIDYVADLRAPTPSAAAELAVYDVALLEARLAGCGQTLNRQISAQLRLKRAEWKALEAKLKKNSPLGRIREKRSYLLSTEERIAAAMKNRILKERHRLALYIEQMKGLSPLDKLNQGYSYVSDEMGRTVTDVNRITVGEQLQIYVKNGTIYTSVTGKEFIDRKGKES